MGETPPTIGVDSAYTSFSELWHTLIAFGRFEIFVSPSVLIFVYWFGAIGIPLLAVLFTRKVMRKLTLPDLAELAFWRRNKALIVVVAVVMFLFAELIWRMIIETILAYFQMRDALINADSI